jgi:tetratricopeptide (TPR) repeat protein
VTSLATEIETAITAESRKKEIASLEKEKKLKAVKEHFDAGQQYYNQGSYHEALSEWEQVLASGVESPETAHVRHAIGHLKTLLAENVRSDYEKGKTYFDKKDYARAIPHLENVARVLPDYADTETLLAQAVNALESEAKRLFQEGLVYEGIGQNEKAAAKWREVLKVMPVETNEYYQKALEKLR